MNPPQPPPFPPEGPTFRRSAAAQRNAPWIVVALVSVCFLCLVGLLALANRPGPVASRAMPADERPLTLPEPARQQAMTPIAKPRLPAAKPVNDAPRKRPKRVASYFDKAESEAKATPFNDFPTTLVAQNADLPPALKPLVVEDDAPAEIDPGDIPIADEVIDQLLEQLKANPSVTNRRNAATSLGKRSDEPDKVVPALIEAARKDPSDQVRVECLKSLGRLRKLGDNEAKALAFLREIALTPGEAENRSIAADALVHVAPNSAEAKQVLRRALVGGNGTAPFSTLEMMDSGEYEKAGAVRSWRTWAYKRFQSNPGDFDWAIPFMIKIADAEINAMGDIRTDTEVLEHIQNTASTLYVVGGKSAAVHAHFKRQLNSVLPEMRNVDQLRVHYDTLLKKIDADKAKKP